MATSPPKISMNVDTKATKRELQERHVHEIADRVRERAQSLKFSARSLGEAVGIPSSTASNYWNGKRSWPSEVLSDLAEVLDTSVEALVRGNSRDGASLRSADDADWVEVPEYALLEIDELGKMDPISSTRFRRDWLYSSLGENSGLWIGRLPAPYDALTLNTGTPLFCRDHRKGERMVHGAYYLFRVNGGIVMARFALRDDGSDEHTVLSRDLGHEEDQYEVVARVVGQLARPI